MFLSAECRLPAQDLERAKQWYKEKLGLEPIEQRPGGLLYKCGTSTFGVYESTGESDGSFTQLSLGVRDIMEATKRLQAQGVTFEQYDIEGFHKVSDIVVETNDNYPSKGTSERACWFRDSEGNLIAVSESVTAQL